MTVQELIARLSQPDIDQQAKVWSLGFKWGEPEDTDEVEGELWCCRDEAGNTVPATAIRIGDK